MTSKNDAFRNSADGVFSHILTAEELEVLVFGLILGALAWSIMTD